MAEWLPWRPVSERDAESTLLELQTAVAQFAEELLADSSAISVTVARGTRQIGHSATDDAFQMGDYVRIWANRASMHFLARAAVRATDDVASQASDALFERFAEVALNELSRRLIQCLGMDPFDARLDRISGEAVHESVGRAVYHFAIDGFAGAPLFRFQFLREAPRHAPKTDPSLVRAALSPRQDALRDLNVSLSAALGRVTLTLDEVASLSPGDVLLLDKPISSPIEVVADRWRSPVGVGFPCRTGTQRAVQLATDSGR